MASNYYIVDQYLGNQPVSATQTFQAAPLGYEARGEDKNSGNTAANMGAGKFVYCRGSNGSAGNFVMIQNNSAVALASANSTKAYPIGVAQGALSATNVFGWVQVEGKCDYALGGTNSSIAADIPLYLCGTAGILHSASAAGSRVNGVVAPVSWTSSQTGAFTVQLFRPFIPGATALQ